MPCSDGRDDVRYETVIRDNPKIAAALCAVLSALASNGVMLKATLDRIDWKEAGVDREYVEDWWRNHKKQDAARRVREAAERRAKLQRERIRSSAIAKLSIEEQRELGILKK